MTSPAPRPPRRFLGIDWAAVLYGAGSVGDLAAGGLPERRPRFPQSGGFAADAAKLAGDGGRAVGRVLPPDVREAAESSPDARADRAV